MLIGGRQGAWVAAAAMATIVAADVLLQRLCPLLPKRMEAEDGIAELHHSDPEVLLIGSSHGRSFVRMAAEVARRSGGARQMVVVPVEYGKLSSYEWILTNRLRPLLEERGPDGAPARRALRRFVLVTEWWDACAPEEELAFNVPARGFTFGHFVADFLRRGLEEWNQNYLDQRWRALLGGSLLVQDRGVGRIVEAARSRLGLKAAPSAGDDPERVASWRAMVERGADDPRCHDGTERAALERILDWARSRSLDTTLLLFPRKPNTLTERARATTLRRFGEEMGQLAARRGLRFVDYTTSTPLLDSDFMADFDHLTVVGNEKLERWAFERELAFLLDPPGPASPAARSAAP